MARSTMQALITRVYRMIGDDTSDPEFSGDEVQTALDRYKTLHRFEQLRAVPDMTGGTVTFSEFCAPCPDWETGATLYDNTYAAIDSADFTEDAQAAIWTFDTAVEVPIIFASGQSYDLYGAAADLLESWASKHARKADMSDGSQSLKRSQMAEGLRKSAADMRRQMRPVSVRMSRSDVGARNA